MCCTFLLRYPESELSWHPSHLNLCQIWWLEYISKSYNIGLSWPGKVMSFLAHLTEGPSVIVSFLTRLTIFPWGNWMPCLISLSRWILCVSKVWPLLEYHVNTVSKLVCGTPIFNKNIESKCQMFLAQLSKHCCMGNVMKFLPPFLKGFLHICCRGYHALFVLGKDIPLKYVYNHIFLSIVLFKLIIVFSFHWLV